MKDTFMLILMMMLSLAVTLLGAFSFFYPSLAYCTAGIAMGVGGVTLSLEITELWIKIRTPKNFYKGNKKCIR